ncbi:MAG: hypothetical protein ACOYIA_00405 [Eubacteriales bacterium]|jgi:hypothetical protein
MSVRRIIALLSGLFVLSILFVSCSTGGDESDETTTTQANLSAETTQADTEETTVLPELDVQDLGEYEFKVLWPEQHPDGHFMHNEIAVEFDSGDVIDSAVFQRNLAVEEKYNVNIVSVLQWCSTVSKTIKNEHLAGEKNYDAFCSPIAMVTSIALEGICADYYDMPYYKEEYVWWDYDIMEDFSIGKAKYFGTGDIIISDNFYPYCVFANLDMYEDFGFSENLYDLVRNKKWTVDKLMELCKNVPSSTDNTWNYEDRYGILVNQSTAKALFYAFGKNVVILDDKGYPQWVMTPEYTQDALDKIIELFHSGNIAYSTDDDIGHNMPGLSHAQTALKMFNNNQALFYAEELIVSERLKYANTNLTFAVLPMPLYDESQSEYCCVLNDAVVVCVPASQDLERSSLILSAMGRESVNTLTPAFYENVLTYRYMTDSDSVETLSLILSSAKAPDIATLLDYGKVMSGFKKLALEGSSNFASVYKTGVKIAEIEIKKLINMIENNQGR